MSRLLTALAGCLGILSSAAAFADVVRLHSGGEVRGKVVATDKIDASGPDQSERVVVETLSGARVELSAGDVDFVTRRPLAVERYEIRERSIADTVDAHWELAQWCREERLDEQHERHCQRVLELAPDHEAAHRALGHVWKDGEWVDWDLYMAERGFVKHKGRWITEQERDLLEKTTAELEREQNWYPKIRLWTGWVTGRHAERSQQGLAALRAIQDVDAAPAVLRLMGRHPLRDMRLLAVGILTRSPGEKSAVALTSFALADADHEIRYAALQGIPESHFAAVEPLFIHKLKSRENAEVNRAAVALQRVGNEASITPLINALVTTHRYNVRVRGSSAPTYSFGTNGSFGTPSASLPPGIEAGLLTGQFPQGVVVLNSPDPAQNLHSKWVVVQQEHQNAEVLSTLQRLTGEDFGYDERSWHLWWAAKKHDGGLSKS